MKRTGYLAKVAAILLLAAMLPQLLYLGHWGPSSLVTSHSDSAHKQHCHFDASGCTHQPAPGGPGWPLQYDKLLITSVEQPPVVVGQTVSPFTEAFITPPDKPPTSEA